MTFGETWRCIMYTILPLSSKNECILVISACLRYFWVMSNECVNKC